jgi:hypothetical protein
MGSMTRLSVEVQHQAEKLEKGESMVVLYGRIWMPHKLWKLWHVNKCFLQERSI